MVKPVVLGARAPSLFSRAVPDAYRRASCDGLVSAYHYLCARGARKFWRPGLERCDLEQVAAIGLIKASRRYDPMASTPFEAYAWIVIVGELMHYVRDNERLVRPPRRLWNLEARFRRAQEVCSGRFGREPTDEELAEEMQLLPQTIAELQRVLSSAVTLQLDDPGAGALASQAGAALEDRVLVHTAFAGLSTVERRVVVGFYVLGLTQLELGRTLGLSARRISRVRQAALSRMQREWAC